jgi:hypothetical protein
MYPEVPVLVYKHLRLFCLLDEVPFDNYVWLLLPQVIVPVQYSALSDVNNVTPVCFL